MDQLAGEAVTPGPRGEVGVVIEAGSDDDEASIQLVAIRPNLPASVRGRQMLDLGAEANVDLVMLGVVLEVLDPRVP